MLGLEAERVVNDRVAVDVVHRAVGGVGAAVLVAVQLPQLHRLLILHVRVYRTHTYACTQASRHTHMASGTDKCMHT